ncbi:MAG: hypothetical protein GY869_29255, partial [Planctomycetes bacterium]|nr:hypothetical protein [Planctomycetota bacterium]
MVQMRKVRRIVVIGLFLMSVGGVGLSCSMGPVDVQWGEEGVAEVSEGLSFLVSFPEEYSSEDLTGRMFVIITRDAGREPREQVGRYGPQLLGEDFEGLKPGEQV